MDDKVLKLVKKLQSESKAVIKDYRNKQIDYEFANGVVIGYDTVISYIEDIWDIDYSNFKPDVDFEE
jgi:hypothetical protein